MAQCRDVFHHTRIPHPGHHPKIIGPRHPEIMLQVCHFEGIGRQLVDIVAQNHCFGGRMPEKLLKGLEGEAVTWPRKMVSRSPYILSVKSIIQYRLQAPGGGLPAPHLRPHRFSVIAASHTIFPLYPEDKA